MSRFSHGLLLELWSRCTTTTLVDREHDEKMQRTSIKDEESPCSSVAEDSSREPKHTSFYRVEILVRPSGFL